MQGKPTELSDVLASAGKNLEYRQTGRDPKTNGYAYAEVPDWKLRWWEETARIMESRLATYEAALREIAKWHCSGYAITSQLSQEEIIALVRDFYRRADECRTIARKALGDTP